MTAEQSPVFIVLGTRVSQARVNLIESDSRTAGIACKNRRHNPDQSHNVITLVKGHALAPSSQPLPMYDFSGVFYGGNLRICLNLLGFFILLPSYFILLTFLERLNSFLICLNFQEDSYHHRRRVRRE